MFPFDFSLQKTIKFFGAATTCNKHMILGKYEPRRAVAAQLGYRG